MTIATIMGANYSTAMDVADSDMASFMGVDQPSSGALLLDGFEGIALDVPTGGLVWTQPIPLAGTTTSLSTSHVTQGTYSFEIDWTGFFDFWYIESSVVDLSAYSTAKCDFFASTDSPDSYIYCACTVNVPPYTEFVISEPSPNFGAGTMTLDISGLSDKSNLFFQIGGYNGSGTEQLLNVDNLRAE